MPEPCRPPRRMVWWRCTPAQISLYTGAIRPPHYAPPVMGEDLMQTATHPRPVRVIVEIDPSQLPSLLAQLVDRFTTHPPVVPGSSSLVPGSRPATRDHRPATSGPPPDPDDEDADAPVPARRGPLPPRSVAHSPPMPVLPPHGGRTRYLGKPCVHGHSYAGSPYGLRKKSNGGCVVCSQIRERARKQEQARRGHVPAPPSPGTGQAARPTQGARRPELPPHLAGSCFLSPILCREGAHRYLSQAYTLRFIDSEQCCMCVAQTRPMAGD